VATIGVADLSPFGSSLFAESDGFLESLNELSEAETLSIIGGKSSKKKKGVVIIINNIYIVGGEAPIYAPVTNVVV
jgi:hypothetical protein